MRLIDADAFKKYIEDGYNACDIKFGYKKIIKTITEGFLADIDAQPTVEPKFSILPKSDFARK